MKISLSTYQALLEAKVPIIDNFLKIIKITGLIVIIKNTDQKENVSRFSKSGQKAEDQMAFYLKRAFGKEREILVINDLRLKLNKDVAQIDHLVVYRYGLIIIESKSVTSKIKVNEHEEWVRCYKGHYQGMPSPIKQAERQADFLKNFLMLYSEKLLRNKKSFKTSFNEFPFEVLVAISDKGIIDRPPNNSLNQVHKADQIVDSVRVNINKYKKENKNQLNSIPCYQFTDTSMVKIVKYLVLSHAPKDIQKKQEACFSYSHQISTQINEYACGKCGTTNITMVYGRYGYYFKCQNCRGNTSLKIKCKGVLCKARIRKEGDDFHKECETCNSSELYFTNSSSDVSVINPSKKLVNLKHQSDSDIWTTPRH